MYSRGKMKKGFTLAEIMIALTIIGVIMAILLPVAQNSLPNEKVMKFKKANATLHKVINELVTSGEYYTPGDLGVKSDGTLIDGSHDGDITYLCNTMTEILSVKNVNCSTSTLDIEWLCIISIGSSPYSWVKSYNDSKAQLDFICKTASEQATSEIILNNNVKIFQTCPLFTFGMNEQRFRDLVNYQHEDGDKWCSGDTANDPGCLNRLFVGKNLDDNNFNILNKIICIDLDEMNKGEDPFGYAVRADGRIVTSARVDEWLEKSIQDKE